ncbi:MAG: hypothetical protein QM756_08370 [Polyangiaceae bacterium]
MKTRWGVWVVTLIAAAAACKAKETAAGAPGASSAVAVSVSAARPAPATGGDAKDCLTQLDYLVAPEKYDNDLFRAIVVDGDTVYTRNNHDVFRVPAAGGKLSQISKGPALGLMGKTELFVSGEQLLTQSAGEPIFMASPKAGGDWKTIIDLTAAKLGGGRDVATRLLQGLGKSGGARATQAAFDGKAFYWAEVKQAKGSKGPSSSSIRSVAASGGEPKTLYEGAGEIGEITKAGEHIVFMHTAEPSAAQVAEQEQARKAKKLVFGGQGTRQLMSIPLAGGEPKKLARISHFIANTVLGSDGGTVYVSGYAEEDPAKPGIFRVDASGGNLEQVFAQVLHGRAFVAGNDIVAVGDGSIDGTPMNRGHVVLRMPRTGKSLERVACISGNSTTHAFAVSGNDVLISLLDGATRTASIVKVPLR